jgi:membrane fusion protein (multidrug efflux system)
MGAGGRGRTWGVRILIAAAAIAVVSHYLPKVVYSLKHVTTDDAYVQASVVPVSPEVSGKVLRVCVDDNAEVAKGDSLLRIDPSDYRLSVEQKRAALATARAEQERIQATFNAQRKSLARAQADLAVAQNRAALAEKDMNRMRSLLAGGGISQSQFDQAESASEVARSTAVAAGAGVAEIEASLTSVPTQIEQQGYRIREAQSALEGAENDLQRTLLMAPVAGLIAHKNVDAGKFVQPGQPLMAIVGMEDRWVLANFKETQIRSMRVGQTVDVMVDAYPGHAFRGHIDSFQPGTGSFFSLLPAENATGNFVKVTQRVPVKVAIDSGVDAAHPLYPGLSARAAVVRDGKGTWRAG